MLYAASMACCRREGMRPSMCNECLMPPSHSQAAGAACTAYDNSGGYEVHASCEHHHSCDSPMGGGSIAKPGGGPGGGGSGATPGGPSSAVA
jgi:hypothetical protein